MTDNVAVIKAFCDAWSTLDIDRIVGFMTPDCFYHNIPIEPVIGHAAIRGFLSEFLKMADACEFVVHAIGETADGAVMTERTDRFRVNGRWIELRVMGIFELRDSRIAAWRDYYDQARMERQLASAMAEVAEV